LDASDIQKQVKNTRKVFVYGNGNAAYRPAAYLKFFLDRPEEYSVFLLTGGFFNGIWKPFRIVLRVVAGFFGLLVSDCLLVLPMNHGSPYARLFLRLGKWMGKQSIVDFYTSAYETRIIDRKLFGPDSAEAQKSKAQDLAALQLADKLIFLNKAESLYYTEVVGATVSQDKVNVCPLVVPSREQADLPFVEGKAGAITVAWWGREGNPLHGFENIAEACRLLLDEGFQGSFAFFASGGKDWEEFQAKFSHLADHPQVLFSKDYNFNNGKLTEFLVEKTDLALGTFGETRKARTVLVNKVLDASAFGIPCLTQFSEGMTEFFEDGKTILVADIDPKKIAEAIRYATSRPQELMEIGENARKLVRSHFSPEKFHHDLDALLTQ
jgi:glycosyltransferase involved in cell wall biosynthesis